MFVDTHALRTCRAAFDVRDALLFTLVVAALIAFFLPTLSSREVPRRALCASNLRGIAQGMHIYANDNLEWFPIHYSEAALTQSAAPPSTGVLWVGSMGSTDFLKISEPTSPLRSPDRSHPSRSLFLLIAAGHSTPGQVICPLTTDQKDALRNHGPDAADGVSQAAIPGRNRFDFSGYKSLSYGYHLPYSNIAAPSRKLDVRMPIAADKGPYYLTGGDGLPGSKTTRDARSPVQPPLTWNSSDSQVIQARARDDWLAYNSRNHAGEGQNVVFVDGHADYFRNPLAGIGGENLYTIANSAADLASSLIGVVPAAGESHGPLTSTDSFIVP